VLGARREHPVRLQDSPRDEVVNRIADLCLVSPETDGPPPHLLAALMPRDEALRRRFLVTGSAVDLPGEKQARIRVRLRAIDRSSVG
jgi:hypothetical protein